MLRWYKLTKLFHKDHLKSFVLLVMCTGNGANGSARGHEGAALAPRVQPQRVATISHNTNYHEKTTLLSSDDEFQ